MDSELKAFPDTTPTPESPCQFLKHFSPFFCGLWKDYTNGVNYCKGKSERDAAYCAVREAQ